MRNIKAILKSGSFVRNYNKNMKNGNICEFDQKFYSQFDGVYFHGLPIYFYFSPLMANGRCYDVSMVLGLAFGKGCYICRGDLSSQLGTWGENKLGHGWVEKDGYVYDTTWKIYCEKGVYEKVFKPVNVRRRESSEFFDECKDISDWTIHDKTWYEQNYSLSNLLISQVREIANLELTDSKLEEDKKNFWRKLLQDLPDETKAKREKINFNDSINFN